MSSDVDSALLSHWERCESAGLPSRFQLSPDGQVRTSRLPLVGTSTSYTLDGQAAVRKALSGLIDPQINFGALLFFHYPSTWNHFLADHAISFRVMPLGPSETQLTTKWLVHKDAIAGVDYDVEELTRVWVATNAQDRRIVRENQIGMNVPGYEPGPYSPIQEGGVRQFDDWYANCMMARLAAVKSPSVA